MKKNKSSRIIVFFLFLNMILVLSNLNNSEVELNDISHINNKKDFFPQTSSWIANGTSISTEVDNQKAPKIVYSGFNSSIIVWEDNRDTGNEDIYSQLVNSTGDTQWDDNGTVICNANSKQLIPEITSDNESGAIITWHDWRNSGTTQYDIYAQRINSSGITQWTNNGTLICNSKNDQINSKIISSDNGSVIISWIDFRHSDHAIYAQKINSSGDIQWQTNGTKITNATGEIYFHKMISDGDGGAILTWQDLRDDTGDIYAQKINSTGATLWMPNGTVISNATGQQSLPQITSDEQGGAIIAWNSGTNDVYAQWINSSGSTLWADNGTLIVSKSFASLSNIVSDGAGGAIILWSDFSSGNIKGYLQRINSSGFGIWQANGNPLSSLNTYEFVYDMISDGIGGAYIAWTDERLTIATEDLYIQQINSTGGRRWETNGVLISNASNDQTFPQIVHDGNQNLYITWEDRRSGNRDIYAFFYIPPVVSNGNGEDNENGGDPTPPEGPDLILILVIVLISGVAAFVSIAGVYSSRKSKKELRAREAELVYFKKQKKVMTEDDITVSKEQHFCLVHKGAIEGYSFICPGCGTYYCQRCINAIKEMENECWSCGMSIDKEKTPSVSKEEDSGPSITPETEVEAGDKPKEMDIQKDKAKIKPKSGHK